MHDARAGEVLHAAHEGVGVEGRDPTVARPAPVDDHRVDERGDDHGVADVARERGALGHGARDDGGGGRGEDVLEEPEREVAPRDVLLPPLRGDADPTGGEEALGLIRAADELVRRVARLVLRMSGDGAGLMIGLVSVV